ncbi:MAG: hypothetical protein K2X27_23110 [Candidatus Obscuribacterales bacterium]|nr:hypothetical protein [Candidatus Obscuribacterales bacterium]
MSKQKNVKTFLGKLESSVNETNGLKALQSREQQHLNPYMQNESWPGTDFVYIGHSENLEHPLVGTEIHILRQTCFSVLFESKGNQNNCVSLLEAMKFAGFAENLSRFEKDLLKQLPPNTLIGPAFNRNGEKLTTAFAIWKSLLPQSKKAEKTEKKNSRVLVKA